MPRRWFPLLVCLSVSLFAAHFAFANNSLRVDESNIRVAFDEEQTTVSLPLTNGTGKALPARARVELLDPEGKPVAYAEQETHLRRGTTQLSLRLTRAFANLSHEARRRIPWFRVHYRVAPVKDAQASAEGDALADAPAPSDDVVEGIVSLSEVTPSLFELRVAAPGRVREGGLYRARVCATNPVTARPVAGVRVEAEIEIDGDDDDEQKSAPPKASGVTGADGYASLDFTLPPNLTDDAIELHVSGMLGDLKLKEEADIYVAREASIWLSTDKPLYQPGQTLHVRALVFDPARRAVRIEKATLKIEDPEGATVFRTEVATSRFGIASADWQIPESARLGAYNVELLIDEDERFGESRGVASVKINRYELPNFAVTVKPDKGYYLPGEQAEVEVRADYLFGQPVKRGRVRVVREMERRWNYAEQKWETDEGEKYEGETDDAGRFLARINLADAHEELGEEDYKRFSDLRYAAYFTDPTTNRTEQRRFDLRVTKDAIHVYTLTRGSSYYRNANAPLDFYITAFYADGAPAACEVSIAENFGRTTVEQSSAGNTVERITQDVAPRTLRTVRTNNYGLAKVSGLRLSPHDTEANREVFLGLVARDATGRTGRQTINFWHSEDYSLEVEPVRTLLRPGDPIEARLKSSATEDTVTVELLRDGRTLRSQVVRLRDGAGAVSFPYSNDFTDKLTIVATSTSGATGNNWDYGSTAVVLYPVVRALSLDVQLAQAIYRPGAEAQADFRVRSPEGGAKETALGVVVFDRAVEERARTDQDFGSGTGFYGGLSRLLGYDESLAGITLRDLQRLDTSKPVSTELDLVADILLRDAGEPLRVFGGRGYESNPQAVFAKATSTQFSALKTTLDQQYTSHHFFPTDNATLARALLPSALDLAQMADPWGQPYRADFSYQRDQHVLQIITAGADKKFDTSDDFTALRITRPYFRPHGETVNRVLASYHARTGGFIRDAATLKSELRREGFDFDSLRDIYGEPYVLKFGARGARLSVSVESKGADRVHGLDAKGQSDDFPVWTAWIDYTAEARVALERALAADFKATRKFPQNEAELSAALLRVGLDPQSLRDAWGNSYYAVFRTSSRFFDRAAVLTYAQYLNKAKDRVEVTPVTQRINYVLLRSRGEDGKEGTTDDFDLMEFSRVVAEQSNAQPVTRRVSLPRDATAGATGAISGTLKDPNGAVVPAVKVTATHNALGFNYEATTNDEGFYLLRNLPAGLYRVTLSATGFRNSVILDVPVSSSTITRLDANLDIGGVTEEVAVTAESPMLETTSTQITERKVEALPALAKKFSTLEASAALSAPASTPRLREYFPETLVWQPALETDREGRAQLKFKLADNITTWKMAVVGSTEDGQIGVAEKEIRAFQPFFVEHEPPRVLTEGDEISLPVVLRNYLERAQTVDVEIKPESWFALLSPARRRAEVAAGDSVRQTFDFRAVSSTREGKQRVTAYASDDSDAIEKSVNVHPDGEEVVRTASQIFGETGALDVQVPADAIAGSVRGELKIYPNLAAHVFEAVEGILQRPYGCGEQTISSGYPSLMLLRHYRPREGEDPPPAIARARRYARAAYERLLGYRADGGGFTYWGRGAPDLALTAYALRFLTDARDVVNVDEKVLDETRAWLVRQQRPDGSWPALSWSERPEDARRTALQTAFVARVLASSLRAAPSKSDEKNALATAGRKEDAEALKRALRYLSARVEQLSEPYLLASYALAATDAGDEAAAARAVELLAQAAREDGDGSFWALETSTPFYGWGQAGRVETTALVVQALARRRGATDALVSRGLIFLLRNKDRYGVWFSTQATVNVLDALLALVAGASRNPASSASQNDVAEVFVNGRRAGELHLAQASRLTGPVLLDLSTQLAPGTNRVEIRRAAASSQAQAQIVSTAYVPWSKQSAAASNAQTGQGDGSQGLRLRVNFARSQAEVGQEISCRVEATRLGTRGYGMLLAEIGLPPGAEVDRESLERTMKESGWAINSYDVLPDRLVVYLWPQGSSTKFDFKFRPRYGLNAMTAPSQVYDYYNPDARAVVAPTRFVVR
ncbi:MAG TPA: alpha-2-macroglobulin family protein [Pyrinomonadaceae bacterium]|nr:alpha-2-macroglobulin family protein [Pyrinomonadaceae bacterium]